MTHSDFSGVWTTVADAERSGHCKVLTDAVVSHVITDPNTGLASGVADYDRLTQAPREVRANALCGTPPTQAPWPAPRPPRLHETCGRRWRDRRRRGVCRLRQSRDGGSESEIATRTGLVRSSAPRPRIMISESKASQTLTAKGLERSDCAYSRDTGRSSGRRPGVRSVASTVRRIPCSPLFPVLPARRDRTVPSRLHPLQCAPSVQVRSTAVPLSAAA